MSNLAVIKLLDKMDSRVKNSYAGKITASCPMARWNHSNGIDMNPSFGVMWYGGTKWYCNCFTCGFKGSLKSLTWSWIKLAGHEPNGLTKLLYIDIYKELEDKTKDLEVKELEYNIGGRYKKTNTASRGSDLILMNSNGLDSTSTLVQSQMFSESKITHNTVQPLPNISLLEKWRREELPSAFLYKRKISQEAYDHFLLGHDLSSRRLMFPVLDLEGSFVGFTGRLYWEADYCFKDGSLLLDSDGSKTVFCPKCRQGYMKYKHWKGRWRNQNVYGLWLCTEGKPIVITEGTTDAIRLWELGVENPVAILGASPSLKQMQLISSVAKGAIIYIMGDGDKAGGEMAVSCDRLLSGLGAETKIVSITEKDPDCLTKEALESYLGLSFEGYRQC